MHNANACNGVMVCAGRETLSRIGAWWCNNLADPWDPKRDLFASLPLPSLANVSLL